MKSRSNLCFWDCHVAIAPRNDKKERTSLNIYGKTKDLSDTKGNTKKDITELRKEEREMKSRRKGICLVLVMMLILGMAGSTALAGERPGSVISTEVFDDLNGFINVEYEKVISSGLSLYAAPMIGLGLGYTQVGATAGAKYYLQGTAPEGLWIGGFGLFTYASILGFSVTGFGGGANVGYKYFITDRFTVEGKVGLAYVYARIGPFGAGAFGTYYGVNVGMAL